MRWLRLIREYVFCLAICVAKNSCFSYFKYPFYDAPTASYCEESKEAFAIGEFLTITDGKFNASRFKGAACKSISKLKTVDLG